MFRTIICGVFLFCSVWMYAQDFSDDNMYLEDQFYVGLTYNILRNRPEDLRQRNLSYGLQVGFIKDMPLNADRTFALGIGLGYGINSYYTNMQAIKSANAISYTFLEDDFDFNRSKIETHLVEMPIQFRWRQSTPNDYKFLRIYGGVKLGYAFAAKSKYFSKQEKSVFQNTDIQKFHYGLQFNVGYNTWNAYVYYGLNNLFKDNIAATNGSIMQMSPIHLGFVFYIL